MKWAKPRKGHIQLNFSVFDFKSRKIFAKFQVYVLMQVRVCRKRLLSITLTRNEMKGRETDGITHLFIFEPNHFKGGSTRPMWSWLTGFGNSDVVLWSEGSPGALRWIQYMVCNSRMSIGRFSGSASKTVSDSSISFESFGFESKTWLKMKSTRLKTQNKHFFWTKSFI